MPIDQRILDIVYTAPEAAEIWGKSPNTVKSACQRGQFREHEARKSKGTWLVTEHGMTRLYGARKVEAGSFSF